MISKDRMMARSYLTSKVQDSICYVDENVGRILQPSEESLNKRFKRHVEDYLKEKRRPLATITNAQEIKAPVAVEEAKAVALLSTAATQTLIGVETKATQTSSSGKKNKLWILVLLAVFFLGVGVGRLTKVPPKIVAKKSHDSGPQDLLSGECGIRGDGVVKCSAPASEPIRVKGAFVGDPIPTPTHLALTTCTCPRRLPFGTRPRRAIAKLFNALRRNKK